jgi:tRNA (guanine37-N1)-methyltransferase
MKIEILTLFPEMFPCVLGASMLKRAQESGLVRIRVRDIRDHATDRHRVADDAPYGGGPGMVMKAEPTAAAIECAVAENLPTRLTRVYVTPDGEPWTQRMAEEFATMPGVLLLCGHYEGIDERVRDGFIDREVSVGDFVLTGGELPAMVIVDSIVRLIPGVLGNDQSAVEESFGHHGLLDCPHYTRPEVFRGERVPEVLMGGHHKKIAEWRRQESLRRTLHRRPDLIEAVLPSLNKADREFVEDLRRQAIQPGIEPPE